MGNQISAWPSLALSLLVSIFSTSSFAYDVYVRPKLVVGEVNAYDLGWAAIPRSNNGISTPAGVDARGWMGPMADGQTFGAGHLTGPSAIAVIPPRSPGRLAKIYTNVYEVTANQRTNSFWLNARVGLRNSDPNSRVLIRLSATAWEFGAAQQTSSNIGEQVIYAGGTSDLWIPVGAAALKPGVQLILEIIDLTSLPSSPLVILDALRFYDAGRRPALSISQPNIAWYSPASQAGYLYALDRMKSEWFRGAIHGQAESVADAEIFRRSAAAGKRNLAIISTDPADFSRSAAYYESAKAYSPGHPQHAAFRARCNDNFAFRLSYADLDLMKNRVRKVLQVFNSQAVPVDAFQIGNELDSICFNGDLPLDRPVVAYEEVLQQSRAYGRYLKAAIEVLAEFPRYKDSKIITYGIAHTRIHSDADLFYHNGYIAEPERQIAMLSNYYGENLLPRVHAYGVHLYPYASNQDPSGIARVKDAIVRINSMLAAHPKPYWITEWGFSTDYYSRVSNPSAARQRDFVAFYDALMGIPNARVENAFHYAVSSASWRLVYDDFTFRPEAAFFIDYRTTP